MARDVKRDFLPMEDYYKIYEEDEGEIGKGAFGVTKKTKRDGEVFIAKIIDLA